MDIYILAMSIFGLILIYFSDDHYWARDLVEAQRKKVQDSEDDLKRLNKIYKPGKWADWITNRPVWRLEAEQEKLYKAQNKLLKWNFYFTIFFTALVILAFKNFLPLEMVIEWENKILTDIQKLLF